MSWSFSLSAFQLFGVLPKKAGAEKGNGPAVVVLLIYRPLGTKVINENGPIAAQNAKRKKQGFARGEGCGLGIEDQSKERWLVRVSAIRANGPDNSVAVRFGGRTETHFPCRQIGKHA